MGREIVLRGTGSTGTGESGMSKLKSMVGIPAGRRTKWLVLVFWLVVVALAGPLSGKLTGAEKNDAQSWLPPAAESTQALALRSKVVSPNVFRSEERRVGKEGWWREGALHE